LNKNPDFLSLHVLHERSPLPSPITRRHSVSYIAIKKEKAVTLNPLLPDVYNSFLFIYGMSRNPHHLFGMHRLFSMLLSQTIRLAAESGYILIGKPPVFSCLFVSHIHYTGQFICLQHYAT